MTVTKTKTIDLANGKTLTITVEMFGNVIKTDYDYARTERIAGCKAEYEVRLPEGKVVTWGDGSIGASGPRPMPERVSARVGRDMVVFGFAAASDRAALDATTRTLWEECRAENTLAVEISAEEAAADMAEDVRNAKQIMAAERVFDTAAELSAWRKDYNDLHNEGGEGYVPSATTRKEREWAEKILAGSKYGN